MDGAGFLLFAREQRASGKARGADDEELYEDWEDLAPAKQREYNDRAARKAAAKAGEKKPAGAVGSKPAPAPPLKTGPAGPSSAAPSPRDPTVKSTAKPTPAASVAAPTADKPGVPKPGVLKPSVSPSSSDAKATVGPAKLKFKQAATVAPSPRARAQASAQEAASRFRSLRPRGLCQAPGERRRRRTRRRPELAQRGATAHRVQARVQQQHVRHGQEPERAADGRGQVPRRR